MRRTLIALLAVLVIAPAQVEAPTPKLAPASGDRGRPVRDHVRARARPGEVGERHPPGRSAIADRERFRDLTRLRASQSIYYAMTEVCKQTPATFEPAQTAAARVRDGTFRVRPPDHNLGS